MLKFSLKIVNSSYKCSSSLADELLRWFKADFVLKSSGLLELAKRLYYRRK